MKSKISFPQILLAAAVVCVSLFAFRSPQDGQVIYEYQQISAIESVVPGGIGRSRLVTTDDRGSAVEKDLKNFYSMVGINFGNIANNDRVIIDRVNEYIQEGWELVHVNSGVQSPSAENGAGIFITRYIFRRPA